MKRNAFLWSLCLVIIHLLIYWLFTNEALDLPLYYKVFNIPGMITLIVWVIVLKLLVNSLHKKNPYYTPLQIATICACVFGVFQLSYQIILWTLIRREYSQEAFIAVIKNPVLTILIIFIITFISGLLFRRKSKLKKIALIILYWLIVFLVLCVIFYY